MKIPNYDTKSPTQGRSLCKFLDEDFRLLISGQSGCGKTNTVMHILRKPLVYYDKIHFFTPIQHQDKIVDLQKVMKPISKKVGYEVLELHSPEEILDTSEYPSNNRKVVVFDDLVNAPDRIQSKIANHWTDGRHHGISPHLSFAILLRCSAEDQVKLFAHDSLSPSDKKTCGSDCKRKLVPTKSVQQAGAI